MIENAYPDRSANMTSGIVSFGHKDLKKGLKRQLI